jgi:ABC-type antimicrobial peptide transport system permease subunit
MAFGATRASILNIVVRRALVLIVTGLAVGLPASLAAGRLLRAYLYGVKPRDGWTYVAITIALLGLSMGAALLPARRATKVDPMVALRYE